MSEQRQRHLMKTDLRVQVEEGGVRHKLSRAVWRSRYCRWRKVKGHLKEGGRSLVAFVLGLLLASLYGVTALFLHKQPLWFSVYTTLTVAFLAAFGMGLSAGVRADVAVMLPTLCSAHGRNFLLFLFISALFSGPLTNTLENTERAASSLLCGAEVAANQTRELVQRATTPLSSMLNRIREISSNAHAVAGRVQKFIHALTDSVHHVARTLRNVLHFLADIGDICNDKLGSPHRKCRVVLTEARTDCSNLLGDFNFLCDIVDSFLPLCNLARAGEVFCIIPSYVASHLKKRLAAPVVAAFEQMKREFNFNISASVNFDLDANISRSLQQMSQEIMKEVSSELQLFKKLSDPLKYAGLVLLALSFLRAMRYRRRYLRDLSFDNTYISAQFEELDRQVTSQGGVPVLPITRSEARIYIRPLSFNLTAREQRAVTVAVVSVFRHLVMGGLLVALDFLVFWMLDQVNHQVKGSVVARAPVQVQVQVNGSGYASDIYRDLVAAFNILQGGNITVISRKCLLEPSEPDYSTCFILGFLLGLALLVSLTGGFVQRCRRLICASYHPERELERIQFLRLQILDQRRMVGKALRRSAARSRADRGKEGGGQLRSLLLRLPGGVYLSHLLGLSPSTTCLACGEVLSSGEDNMVTCDVPQCSGLYCRPCFLSLGNTCVICVRPLTSQEDGEEELDSSNDEQLCLTLRPHHPQLRRVKKRRISMATWRRPTERSSSAVTMKDGADRGESDGSRDVDVQSELSEADGTYQDRLRSEKSDNDGSFHSTGLRTTSGLMDQTLAEVVIHRPDGPQILQGPPGHRPQDSEADVQSQMPPSQLFHV